jgi:hypothetical protein
VNHAYFIFISISRDIDPLISSAEHSLTKDSTIINTLMRASSHLIEADSLLNQYKHFSPSVKLNYGAIPNFEDIALTLGFGFGTINGTRYNCISNDSVISENEVLYLTALRDDLVRLAEGMQSTEYHLRANENLSLAQFENILQDFFMIWSYHNENSPFFLLLNE